MKKFLLLTLFILLILNFNGCSKLEYKKTVLANIISKEYSDSYFIYTPMIITNPDGTTTTIHQQHFFPEQYNVKLEYNGDIFNIDSKEIFEYTEGCIEIDYYENKKGKVILKTKSSRAKNFKLEVKE